MSPLLPFCLGYLQCQQCGLPTSPLHSSHETFKVILWIAASLASLPLHLSPQGLTDVSSKHLPFHTFPSFPSPPHLNLFPYSTLLLFVCHWQMSLWYSSPIQPRTSVHVWPRSGRVCQTRAGAVAICCSCCFMAPRHAGAAPVPQAGGLQRAVEINKSPRHARYAQRQQ